MRRAMTIAQDKGGKRAASKTPVRKKKKKVSIEDVNAIEPFDIDSDKAKY